MVATTKNSLLHLCRPFDQRDPAQTDAGAPFALEKGELQRGADVDIRQAEVVIVVLIGGGHDPASVLEGEEGGEVHH